MTTKILASFAALSCVGLASGFTTGFAQVTSSVERLPVFGSGNCPVDVLLGLKGESFVSGIRHTVSTKTLIEPGTKLEILGVDANTIEFSAPLKAPYKNCVGVTAERSIFNELSWVRVAFEEGAVWVTVHVGPSLRLNLTSTYNGQVIFDLAERL